jgi:hypothetical protein
MGAPGSRPQGWLNSATWWTTPQRAVSGAQPGGSLTRALARSHSQRRHLEPSTPTLTFAAPKPKRPGSLLPTHSGPRATAVCFSSAAARDVTPSSWPGGLPGDRIGTSSRHRRGISAMARGSPGPHRGGRVDMTCASLLRLGDRVLVAASSSASRSPMSRCGDLPSRLVQVTMPVRQRQSCRPEPISRRDRRGLDGGRFDAFRLQ